MCAIPGGSYGKSASSTLCPVSRGWLAASFSVMGLIWRTGHTYSNSTTHPVNYCIY